MTMLTTIILKAAQAAGASAFLFRRRHWLGVGLIGALLTGSTWAGNFSVTPVRIYMTPKDRAVAITLTNEGDSDVALQADVYAWSQKPDGSDDLVLTEELIVSPPIIKLGKGARQVVRLARLTPPDLQREITYRMIVREVPEVTAPKAEKGMVLQMPIALAMSMPVFITPPEAKREVGCVLSSVEATSLTALCQNSGNAYAQIRQLLVTRGGQELAKFEGGTYILPGVRRSISLKSDKPIPAGAVQLKIVFDDAKSADVAVILP